ncbi:MAG: transposase [Mycobacterium sp.]
MSVNVRAGDVDQLMMMPPSVREWLPEDHLAFFVLDVVAELDLSAFYATYRVDGRGGPVYDPAMMLAVLLYAYCTGERSSRRIERRLLEDVALRVVAANQQPDHATLARFCRRHQDAIAELFGQVLRLCVKAGLVDAGMVAIDGTKIAANASFFANRDQRPCAASSVDLRRRIPQLRPAGWPIRSWPKPSRSTRPKTIRARTPRTSGCRRSGPGAGSAVPDQSCPR